MKNKISRIGWCTTLTIVGLVIAIVIQLFTRYWIWWEWIIYAVIFIVVCLLVFVGYFLWIFKDIKIEDNQ